ncbi:MAG: hypothetical protein B7W98_02455, partial [Parcubacteria group bacterium 20-58-5]
FRRWVAKEFYEEHEKAPGQSALASALNIIEAEAQFKGPEIKLHSRVAQYDGALWYDLCDKLWRAVRITPEGWSIVDNPPIIFKRYPHQAAQVEPIAGDDAKEILRFVNITEPEHEILFLACLISFFIPGFPHPMPYVHGPQGSAKSTLSKIVRKIVDPSRIEVLSLPKDNQELAQALSHHHLLFFDNVSYISASVADLLCRAVTGSGFSKRQLYTDDEDIIYTIQANIGINGISLASNKPDLLERSVLFELRRVEKSGRRQERELLEEFEQARPRILGAIFDVIARALAVKPTITVEQLPRMADFALWGCAIAEALEIGQKTFLAAYARNISSQSEELINDSAVATLIKRIVDDRGGEWSSSPGFLFTAFKNQADAEKIVTGRLPSSPSALMREINRLKTPFEETGYQIESSSDRTVTIHKITSEE